jgi:hypothetical protein
MHKKKFIYMYNKHEDYNMHLLNLILRWHSCVVATPFIAHGVDIAFFNIASEYKWE